MISVIKANGEIEPFSEDKVIRSIKKARIPESIQPQVLLHVKRKLYNNIPTSEIYHHIIEFLGMSEHPYTKAKYGLKQAIMALGPTGYPFEDFVAKVLDAHGYHTKIRQIVEGSCVTHEIDIIAAKNGKTAMIEAKFHNNPGTRSDIHVALYTKARFDDVKEKNMFDEPWVVTNTKITIDAIDYARCAGMKVIGWSYPEGESLRDLVEKYHLHPVTMLNTLAQSLKQNLLDNHIVLCKDICLNKSLIDILPISPTEKQNTLAEVEFICKEENNHL